MKIELPPLPPKDVLADVCREVAGRERLNPEFVEKDFYLTRVLWALGQLLGNRLLLKGGTLLSKVDLGFLRMSEDVDVVVPGKAAERKRTNALEMNRIRDALVQVAATSDMRMAVPHGDRTEKDAHVQWTLDYQSEFGSQGILVEASIRPVLKPPREVRLRQMVQDVAVGDYQAAKCWALDFDEARAEKVRAGFTREAIRDFYDLHQLLEAGADLSSLEFISLVDAKLAELGAPPIAAQKPRMNVDAARRRALEESLKKELPGVLRIDAPPFSLDDVIDRLDLRWRDHRRSG